MSRARTGFSLVEVMIVVAIIAILAAIAIPNFMIMQLKAKRSEVATVINGIRTCEMEHSAVFGEYVTTPTAPREDAALDKSQVPWVTSPEWTLLGFVPDGALRGNYSVVSTPSDFVVYGHADVDDDGELVMYTATSSIEVVLDPAYAAVY